MNIKLFDCKKKQDTQPQAQNQQTTDWSWLLKASVVTLGLAALYCLKNTCLNSAFLDGNGNRQALMPDPMSNNPLSAVANAVFSC